MVPSESTLDLTTAATSMARADAAEPPAAGRPASRADASASQSPAARKRWRALRDAGVCSQRPFWGLLVIALVALVVFVYLSLQRANRVTESVRESSQVLIESQRIGASTSQALFGNSNAYAELEKAVRGLDASVARMVAHQTAAQAGRDDPDALKRLQLYAQDIGMSGDTVLELRPQLTQFSGAGSALRAQAADLAAAADTAASYNVADPRGKRQLAAARQLAGVGLRVAQSAANLLTQDPIALGRAEVELAADVEAYARLRDSTSADFRGDGVAVGADAKAQAAWQDLLERRAELDRTLKTTIASASGVRVARSAQAEIAQIDEPLRQEIAGLQQRVTDGTGSALRDWLLIALALALAVVAIGGLIYQRWHELRARQAEAEARGKAAQAEQIKAKQVNDRNQAAILRLMDELQEVSEGDLTKVASVTTDVTGAIADSVNVTVEELRSLVARVERTALEVGTITAKAGETSTELLSASEAHLKEIRSTGEAVLQMADRIRSVSAEARQSAAVARQSVNAARTGYEATQDAIGGMNTIRGQIQETSKSIKRLGESSQEIGEITELISSLTEQTNVLALNAAIQAASAGEAGRGFAVVAEEVQRLAERSAAATRQIAALVSGIQTDAQAATAAMERSTQGVVEGARLSDKVGSALSEIDGVSHRLAELIERISGASTDEARHANDVAASIRRIFAVTEQNEQRTRASAAQIDELARVVRSLRESVARFKIA